MSLGDGSGLDLANRPRTPLGVVTATALALLAMGAARVGLASVLADPVQPVTALGVLGGVLGAGLALVVRRHAGLGVPAATRVWSHHVAGTDPESARTQGAFLHLLAGAVAGGWYPWLFATLGFRVGTFAALPASLAVGLAFGVLVWGVAIGLVGAGVLDLELYGQRVARLLSLQLLYGLAVGAVVGLWCPVLAGVV
jgi:hypothetical protein